MTATLTVERLDADAFADLWRTHRDIVRGYLNKRCPQVADELLSETFCRAWAGRHTFRPEAGSARSWLFGIARHVLTDHLRHVGCRVPLVFIGEHVETLLADPRDRAGETVERLAVYAALEQLPDAYRRVLTLRFLLDLDVPQTAAALGLPAGTVKSHTYRALRALTVHLGLPDVRRAG